MLSRVDVSKENIDSTNEFSSILENIQEQKDTVQLKHVFDRLYAMVMQLHIEDSVNSFNHFVDSLHYNFHIDDSNFTMRYQTYIVRVQNPVVTFKNLVASFEAAAKDSLIVGVNIVAPEDNPVSMKDYWLHMHMFDYCHQKYPSVRYSMHAGEITEGYVQPEALTNHITEAVYVEHNLL